MVKVKNLKIKSFKAASDPQPTQGFRSLSSLAKSHHVIMKPFPLSLSHLTHVSTTQSHVEHVSGQKSRTSTMKRRLRPFSHCAWIIVHERIKWAKSFLSNNFFHIIRRAAQPFRITITFRAGVCAARNWIFFFGITRRL
jgi:hypothetical protein